MPTSATDKQRMPAAMPAGGFTLLELLVVLAILLIASSVLLPNLDTLDNSSFNAQVRRAVAVLNHARRMAIVDGAPRSAYFHVLDPARADYAARRAAIDAQTQEAIWSSKRLRLRFRDGVNAPAEERQRLQVVFYPQGGSTGGLLEFVLNTRSVRIWVDPISGRITPDLYGEGLVDVPQP